jgi:hypothetical protein
LSAFSWAPPISCSTLLHLADLLLERLALGLLGVGLVHLTQAVLVVLGDLALERLDLVAVGREQRLVRAGRRLALELGDALAVGAAAVLDLLDLHAQLEDLALQLGVALDLVVDLRATLVALGRQALELLADAEEIFVEFLEVAEDGEGLAHDRVGPGEVDR